VSCFSRSSKSATRITSDGGANEGPVWFGSRAVIAQHPEHAYCVQIESVLASTEGRLSTRKAV
jgi:hypothetical protein